MTYRWLLGAAVATGAALAWAHAEAQWIPGLDGSGAWYIGGEGGWTSLDHATASAGSPLPSPGGTVRGSLHFSDGFNIGARAGVMAGPWRFEEEFRFQGNDVSSLAGRNATGHMNGYAFMTNAIYDFDLGTPVSPHLGGGIGAVDLGAHGVIPATNQSFRGSDWQFGYQAIAGIRYNIDPALALDLDYRFLGTTRPTFAASTGGGPSVPSRSNYNSQSLVASLSFMFGSPPPPPPPPVAAPPLPPAPLPVARRVFLVFFDWDRDTITPQGEGIIDQAARAYRAGAPVRIMVTGYTDRSGSPGYNQRLSERRANNVANALMHLGVPRNQMAVSGRGENDNRVPTAPGVREPQNRRVEVVFR